MSYKTLIATVTALAISPMVAFAAPAAVSLKTKPAVVKQVKGEKVVLKQHHMLKKATAIHKHTKVKVAAKI